MASMAAVSLAMWMLSPQPKKIKRHSLNTLNINIFEILKIMLLLWEIKIIFSVNSNLKTYQVKFGGKYSMNMKLEIHFEIEQENLF